MPPGEALHEGGVPARFLPPQAVVEVGDGETQAVLRPDLQKEVEKADRVCSA